MRRFLIGLCLLFVTSAPESAQAFCPPGSSPIAVGGGIGAMGCQCPDGSLADITGCRGGYQQPSGYQCGYGTCPHGTTCCGTHCCNAGSQCSRGGGCVPEGTVDCGSGSYCPSDRVCWKAPAAVAGIKRGEVKCPTPDGVAALEREIAMEKEEKLAQERREREEKKRAAEDAKFKADAPARQKVSELLKDDVWKQRSAALQKSATETAAELRRVLGVPSQQKSTMQKLCDIAWEINTPDWKKNCLPLAHAQLPPAPVVTPGSAQATDLDWARKQLEALAKGQPVASPATPAALTKQQYDYLRTNAAVVQPEQRTIPSSLAVAPPPPNRAVPSTFHAPPMPRLQPINRETATSVYPYAQLSQDAYSTAGRSAAGYRAAGDWEALLRKTGVESSAIEQLRKSGFDASLFVTGSSAGGNREVVVSFRGTDISPPSSVDIATDIGARLLRPGAPIVPTQYAVAEEIVRQVQTEFPNARIVVTGHSLGGAIASYAGNRTGVTPITFNAARNAYSTAGEGRNQINIVTRGDVVGDPTRNSVMGVGELPGTTYIVDSPPGAGLVQRHSIGGIIDALSGAAAR